MFFSILGTLIGLLIHIILCSKFSEFAAEKGYYQTKYYWICFFLGIFGYIWAAALPDKALQYKVAELAGKYHSLVSSSDANNWVCSFCHTENSANNGQCKNCGRYRN